MHNYRFLLTGSLKVMANFQQKEKKKKKSPQPVRQQEVIQWGTKMTCATGTSSLGESSEGESSAVTAKQQLFKAKQKAGVSSTKSLQLTEGLMISTS